MPLSESDVHLRILKRLRRAGLDPGCIVDIGASNGTWARIAHSVFPLAELHLFEPLAERDPSYRDYLANLLATPGVRARVYAVAVDEASGSTTLRMTGDPVQSSLLPPGGSTYFPDATEVEVVSLDDFWREHDFPLPTLLKLDTQGSELRILHGAARVLETVEAVVAELWTWPAYGPHTPLASHVSQWLLLQGFYLSEFGAEFRDEEQRLIAFDAVFTRPSLRPTSEPLE